ncbi:MAG: hypothetical protein WA639_23060, partial [Candidatus Acidiferrum sp.]
MRGEFCVVVGRGVEVLEILVQGIADGFAPFEFADGGDEFLLREMEGLEEGLGQVGQGSGGFGLDVATGHSGEEAGQGGAEIAGVDEIARKEIGQVLTEIFGGAGLRFFAGVVEAEMRMAAGAGSTAAAAIGEGPIKAVATPSAWLYESETFLERLKVLGVPARVRIWDTTWLGS